MAQYRYTGLLIALGCVALAIGGSGCRSDDKKPEQGTTLAATESVTSPKSEVAPAPAGANPACTKAEACCRAMVKKLPTAQQNFAACADVHKMAESNCVPMYEKYRQAAQALGVTCD